jgi:polysaccharide export outer membrane protein/exopolysaccharide production protein ExoF
VRKSKSKTKLYLHTRRILWNVWLLPLFLVTGAAASEEYTLSTQDKVRVGVVEWLPTSGDFRSPINGEFIVNPSGNISLPLIGDIPAFGSTPAALADAISEKLGAKLGLESKPKTSVEVVQYRPFYIAGNVERPGEFAYRPRLTVLQALSIAGGLQRPPDGNLLQLEREAAAAREDIKAMAQTVDEFTAREARLEAELSQATSIKFPQELVDRAEQPQTARLMALEQILFDTRRRLFGANLEGQKKFSALLAKELQSQQVRMSSLKKEQSAVERQLEAMQNMELKGLAAPGRMLDLVRAVSEISGKLRELDAQALRTQQEHLKVEETISNASAQRQHEVGSELMQVKTKLNDLRQRLQTNEQLISVTDRIKRRAQEARLTIIRDNGSMLETIDAVTEGTLIRPGDVLKVDYNGAAPVAVSQNDAPPMKHLPEAVSR